MNQEFYISTRPFREIRAVYDDETVRVYQAFASEIAQPALVAQTFVPPFRTDGVVTWVKPSFLWCMKRTRWGVYTRISKKNTRREEENNAVVLGIDIKRTFFNDILSNALITHRQEFPEVDAQAWSTMYRKASVRVQWDPEKTLEGNGRPYEAIQIGLSKEALVEYTKNIVRIQDMKDLIEEITSAKSTQSKISILPDEQPYPVSEEIYKRLNMGYTK
jgi:hypothetical protein